MKRATVAEKAQRIEHINALIKIISDYGRRFFYDARSGRVARMAIGQKGHIYFQDDYSGKLIYVAYRGNWRGFNHGGTLQDLVNKMANYVRTGDRLGIGWFGPERKGITDGNIWGYDDDEIAKCRAEAAKNPAVKP